MVDQSIQLVNIRGLLDMMDIEKSPDPPMYSLPHGFQNDDAGTLWVAVAHTQWGDIPGNCNIHYGSVEEFQKRTLDPNAY